MSRNLKATAVTTGLYLSAFALGILGAMVKPETRIVGTIGTKKVDIPAWLQNEPEYDKKIKNAKVEQGWGGLRLVLWGLAVVPAGLGLALSCERQGELEKERKQYDRECREEDALGEVKSLYKVSLTKAVLQKRGEATIALVEDELEDEVDSIREANGWYAPEVQTPQRQIEPPLLREPEATQSNPFEGMKTPAQYAKELEDACQGAIAKLPTDGEGDRTLDNTADTRYQLYQERGEEILRSLAGLRMSILSAAPTGAGKTHTMDRYIRDIRREFPKVELYVISEKLDSFVGLLEAGRVKKFDMNSPESSMAYLDLVHKEMHKRLDEPKANRVKYNDRPIRLILDDWHATQSILKFDANHWRIVGSKINQIVTLGREANVCIYIATQTFNLAALGMDDSNIRGNLAITCQGLVTVKTDNSGKVKKQGNYDILQLLLKNAYIVPNADDREELAREVKEVIQLSKTHQLPAVFCAIDEATLALVPYIEIAEMAIESSNSESIDVAIVDSNDDNELPNFTYEDVQNFRQSLQKSENSTQFEQPQKNADNDDGMRVSGFEQSELLKNEQPTEPELVNWYRWLPSKSEMIRLLENNDANLYNFPSFVRSKLKKSETTYNRRTKNAIVQLLITLGRNDLIEKYQIDTKIYPLSDYPNG